MPIKHAALRQLRKDAKRNQRNRAVQSELKTLIKRLIGLLRAQKLDEATTVLHEVTRKFDRAVTKGVIHRNTAGRFKSRLTKRVAQHATPRAS